MMQTYVDYPLYIFIFCAYPANVWEISLKLDLSLFIISNSTVIGSVKDSSNSTYIYICYMVECSFPVE